MILLDTHIWIWWVHADSALPSSTRAAIDAHLLDGVAVSAISCWEIAKLVERRRLELPYDIHTWIERALDGSGVTLVPLSPAIAIASTILPGTFHLDPADQIIVATSRVLGVDLVTCDTKIRSYPHVRLLEEGVIHDR